MVEILPMSVRPELVRFSGPEDTRLFISTFLKPFAGVNNSFDVVESSLWQRVDEDGGVLLSGFLEWDKAYIYRKVIMLRNNLIKYSF